MCDACSATFMNSGARATSRLKVARTHFESEAGQREPPHYREEIEAAQRSLAAVLSPAREDRSAPIRATEEDVAALERARRALLSMSKTDAGQVKPYLDFSEDQLEIARGVSEIKSRWSADPMGHPPAS